MIRIGGLLVIVVAKALVGREQMHPLEMLWESIEIAGVFVAGLHASHWMHRKEDKHGSHTH